MFATLYNHPQQILIAPSETCGIAPSEICGSARIKDEGSKKYGKIQDGLESSISLEGRARITKILGEVHSLTDVEKLLLYLKLPTGLVQDDQNRLSPPSCLPTSNRKEQGEAFTWIKSHLEEHGDVCMPKAEVYDQYRQYCDQHDLRPLCNADFGKMMKQVFPEINTRRLGQRGQSKYFYGGLRKKTDHAPPTLPELEIITKSIEIDSTAMDSELFKSSCQLVCEWADKVLDMKFYGVQEIAEHLLVKTSVNTKSVAAFTLIAAMQESGKYNLKGSALFCNQVNAGGDKHKETNLLLQRKLQQNKDILKQKEKAQALRDELQQQMGSQGNSKSVSGSKTPVSTQKKTDISSTVSSSASSSSVAIAPLKSPRIPSSNSNPLTAQSPQRFQSPKKPISPWLPQKTSGGQGQNFETGSQSNVADHATGEDFVQKNDAQSVELKVKVSESMVAEKKKDYFEGYQLMDTDSDCVDEKSSANDTNVYEAKTPENPMETDHSELSHVRKINFDDLVAQNNKETCENVEKKRQHRTIDDRNNVAANTNDKLSKSTGFLSLKKMLENKSENQSSLNKSMGYSGKSKTALFVNQSTVPGRSAFVPFSQVQSMCRKDNSNVNQSVAMTIPVIIPSAAQTQSNQTMSQSTNITMLALPTDLQSSPTKNPSDIIQNETILSLLPASSVFKQPGAPRVTDVAFPMPLSDSVGPPLHIQNQTKESMSIMTVSSLLSKMAGSECVVSSAQSVQNLPKQLRTKFTPIRPKASPNKVQPQKEVKAELPTYDKDKRPVSAILKEKRAKEHAEAIAKFQSSIQLPTIPIQPSISLTGNQLSTLQGIQAGSSNIPPNEVVIIVNNRPVKLQQVLGQNSMVAETTVAASNTLSNPDISFQTLVADNMINADANATLSETADGNIVNLTNDSDAPSEPNVSDDNDLKEIGSVSSDMKEFSPMSNERDVTPILCEDDDADTVSEIGTSDNNNLDARYGYNKCINNEDVTRVDNAMIIDIVQPMWIETPIKIQKLNITSPFQDESTVALGRETPVKISKPSDLCLSRPESAETYGRETPSGARKRKSSDFHPRHDFKRLNSTGEDTEDQHNLSSVFSPDNDLSEGLNPRRTQSCTYELERENKAKHHLQQQQQQQQIYQQHKQSGESLLQGLQSPDIHSLEREALIESFPNSLYAMKPHHKSHKNQSSSVGVSAKTLRQSQQKLIKQQQYLDERVKNFLQTQIETSQIDETEDSEPVSRNSNQRKISQISPGSRTSLKTDNFIVTDRGKPYQRPWSAATVCSRSSNLDVEPSGLPSEVADWINETIEKRQKTNQSAMSEPEYRDYQSMKADRNPKQQNFRFEVDHVVQSGNKSTSICTAGNKISKETSAAKNSPQSSNDDSNFTVPKAPPVSNFRSKETLRSNTELSSVNQRCQSLPIFVSPVQSPVSPMAPPINHNHGNTRAASMSPRAQVPEQSTEILSPTSGGILSPVRRKEIRDGQVVSPAQASLYPGLGHRDSKQGTYLASIQHSLQKPVDTSHDLMSPQDVALGKHPLAIANLGGKPQSLLEHGSREPSIDADDHYVSHAPFSDSGYQSCGPSPILNSTPVSVADHSELVYGHRRGNSAYKHAVVASPVTMVTEYTSPVPQLSPQQSPINPQLTIHQQNVTLATSQMNNLGVNPNQLRSSIHSAFIPIQGSHHDVRYVTPIKPMVTLPSSSQEQYSISGNGGISSSLFIDANQSILGAEVTMVSPRSADPPSYEVAIKQLKTSTSSKLGPEMGSQSSEVINKIEMINVQNSKLEQQRSLLASMDEEQTDNLGPFAQKLMKLSSHQTLNGGKDIQMLLRRELMSSNMNTVSIVTNPQSSFIPTGNDLSILPPNFGNSQSVSSILPPIFGNSQSVSSISNSNSNPNGANLHFNFTGDLNAFTDNRLIKDDDSQSDQTKTNLAVKPSVLSNSIPQHSMLISNSDDTVLNIDPSFHSSSHFGSANQTAEEILMSSSHHPEAANLNENENNQLLNKPSYSFSRDFKESQRFQVANAEINLFSNNGTFDGKENANTIKNVLIGGKLASQDLVRVGDSGQNKPGISPQELMDDIGLPWESLREIEGDMGDFNMFN